MTIKRPYLVQRYLINALQPATAKFSESAAADYMGASEFEGGAQAKMLRTLQAAPVTHTCKVPEIMENEQVLRVYSALNNEDFAAYKERLLEMRKGDAKMGWRLLEPIYFQENPPAYHGRNYGNMWADLENAVIWSFHKLYMNRLPAYLANSFKYMDEQKVIQDAKDAAEALLHIPRRRAID